MSEERTVDWRELGRIEEDMLVEIIPVMKGGENEKKKTENPWEGLASESEKRRD